MLQNYIQGEPKPELDKTKFVQDDTQLAASQIIPEENDDDISNHENELLVNSLKNEVKTI